MIFWVKITDGKSHREVEKRIDGMISGKARNLSSFLHSGLR